jgi:hypothetical protein
MAEIFDSQTFEYFNRLNTNGNSDWTLSGSGTGEYYYTVAGTYDSNSLFYAGNVLLVSGTAGSLAAGEFNLTGTTLTVRLPADALEGVTAGSDPDSAPSGHVKGFDVVSEENVITDIAASTEADVTQVALINEDSTNDITAKLYRIESDGTRKSLTSVLTITGGDTVYVGAFGLQTGETFAIRATGAMSVDSSINKRSTT